MNDVKKVLLVEDDFEISDVMRAQLEIQGYAVTPITDGKEALNLIQDKPNDFDLIILDRMLPGATGLELCKFIRMFEKTKSLPILMVTALSRPEDIVDGLSEGADDYITKPFDMGIFKARINALIRRYERLGSQQVELNIYEAGGIKVDTDSVKAYVDGEEIELTKSEFKLLSALLESAGKVLTRTRLVEIVQDGPVHVTERTIDTHVFGLRKKLGDSSRSIETIRGIGYRVVSE